MRHLDRGLADGRLLGKQELDVTGPFYLLMVGLLATDALDLADVCLEQALADARARASIPALAFVIAHQGWCSLRRGAVTQAEATARTALELLTAHDIWLGSAFALGLLIEALIETDEAEAADRVLCDSATADQIPLGLAFNDLLEARGLLRLAQGRGQRQTLDGLRLGCSAGGCSRVKRADLPLAGLCRRGCGLFGEFDGDGFQFGDELAQAAVGGEVGAEPFAFGARVLVMERALAGPRWGRGRGGRAGRRGSGRWPAGSGWCDW